VTRFDPGLHDDFTLQTQVKRMTLSRSLQLIQRNIAAAWEVLFRTSGAGQDAGGADVHPLGRNVAS
jgi:hypothetical protein